MLVRFSDTKPGVQPKKGPVLVGPLTQHAIKNAISDFIITDSSVTKEYKDIVPGLTIVKLPEGVSVVSALIRFNRSANILYAEPNYKIRLSYIPLDPDFVNQWALNNTGQTGGYYDADIDAPEAWDIPINISNEIIVAVTDTGIDYYHPDLIGNMWINPGEVWTPGVVVPDDVNEVDDDGNGFVDDIFGYDFVEPDFDPCDEHYHGTHVAGIIGAVGDNREGIAGVSWNVNWNVRLMALRILNESGVGDVTTAIDAIRYAIMMGVDVINASWATEYNNSLYWAIRDACDAQILFVAASGNDGSYDVNFPAAFNLDNIISVLSTNHFDNMSVFSNYGDPNVDLGAPGEEIYSTTPVDSTGAMDTDEVAENYDYLSGTSMAAPHVSAACALMKGMNPNLTNDDVKALLLWTVDKVLPPGLCVSDGRLNLFKALATTQYHLVLNKNTGIFYPSIQSAIDSALTVNGHTLIANVGIAGADMWYFELVNFHGKKIYLRSGDIFNPPSYGPLQPGTTYISAFLNKKHAHGGYVGPVVTFNSGETANTKLAGFTIIDGDSGIYCSNSSPVIYNCIVTQNEGRGIDCQNSSSTIEDCTISSNSSNGIYCNNSDLNIVNCTISGNNSNGIYCTNSDPNIIGCTISTNSAWGSGGGVSCNNGSDPNIYNCFIASNVSELQGGGIYVGSGTNPNIRNCTISSNEAYWEGGGIYLNNASPIITDSNITGCYSQWDGGGIYCDNGAEPDIKNCFITENMAAYYGGSIYCNGTSPLIKNCLFVENKAESWHCGGIFCWNASPTIANCTFVGNSSNEFDGIGGAIFCYNTNKKTSKPAITNCIFSDNNDIAIYEYEPASDPNIRFCLFYNNPDGDYYDKDSGAVHNFNSLDPNNFLATMRHYDIDDFNDSNNIGGNPMFVRGRLGNYYLSQFDAGQILDVNGVPVDPNVNPEDATGPAVDAGSGDANDPDIAMHLYSTRTDNYVDPNTGEKDLGLVDIGFHYNDPVPAVKYHLVTSATNGTISPPSGYYTQYTQVLLKAASADPNLYQLKYWYGTDDDTSMEPNNIVTMSSNRNVTAVFETILVELRCRVVGGNGMLVPTSPEPVESFPGRYKYYRGTVVHLTATPINPAHYVIWSGQVDDEYSYQRTNTVTMSNGPLPIKPFQRNPQTNNDFKEVKVKFYAPRILNVPGDYTNIQHAIDDAQAGDIVLIAPSTQPYLTVRGYEIIDKAITITSTNPDDPNVVAQTVIQHQEPGPDGREDTAFRFYLVEPNTILNGLTISGFNINGMDGMDGDPSLGFWDGVPGVDVYGSGIYCAAYGSPTIRNCIITNCIATGGDGGNGAGGDEDHPDGGHGGWPGKAGGAGISCIYYSNPIVINCTFDDCHVIGGIGGDGGDGSEDPLGVGGRGGGWHYPIDPPTPYEWGPYPFFYTWYSGHGGAVYADESSSPKFIDCTFTDNSSEGGNCGICGITPLEPDYREEPTIYWKIDNFGGAVYLGNYPYDYEYAYYYYGGINETIFENCTFNNNMADPNIAPNIEDEFVSYGGAIAFEKGVFPTFNNCTFNDNLATIGGAMYWEWAEPIISDCNFVANQGIHGGGLYFVGGSAEITQSKFSENQAIPTNVIAIGDPNFDPNIPPEILGQGGGIYCFDANALIADCVINNNDADGSGGGIYIGGIHLEGEEPVHVKNCLITDNSANRDGGGISANFYSKSKISNCTITDNMVTGDGFERGYGGGLYCSYNSYVNVIDSIIWDNSGNIGAQGSQIAVATGFVHDPRPSTVEITYSDVQGATDPNAFGARRESLDLVFCIDSTGSMDDDIDAVQDAASKITKAISDKIPDFRIAVIDYKDFNQPNLDPAEDPYGGPTDYPYRTDLEFTTDTNEVINALNSLSASGGADQAESVYTALMHCIDHASLEEALAGELYGADPASEGPGAWRPGNVLRVIILMGDAPPHDPEPFTDYTLGDITAAAVSGESKIIMPLLIGDDPNATIYFGNIASGTRGIVMQAAAADEVVDALLDAINLISLIPDPIFIDADCILNWNPDSFMWDPNSHNINEDPLFVAGYYLSQFDANQPAESNCVDGGSDLSANLGLDTYTTRTDSVADAGIVDMGYHYNPFIVPQYELTINAFGVNVIKPNIYDPNYDGFYNWHTTVPLAVASTYDANIYQVSWNGTDNDDPNYGGPSNTVTMDRDKTVTIRLVKTKYALTIAVDGGNGRLSAEWSEAGGPRTIQAPYTEYIKFGTEVKLIAKPDEGYRVKRWTGTDDNSSRARTNTVTINDDKTVSVEFGLPITTTVPSDYPTIQEAISAAEEGDTIVVYSGTYEGNINLQGKEITVVSANPDDPNVIAVTIIDCDQSGRGFIFNSGEDVNTVINGFTIINGNIAGVNGGGGIFTGNGTSPIIMNTVISNCNAEGDPADPNTQGLGGGIYINVNSSPTFINCDIINCSADRGGGAYCESNSSPTFRHCTFSDNLADWGGGLLCGPNSSTTITDCNFANNDANNGGGLYGELNSSVTIDESSFNGNTAASYGGAIFWFGGMEIFDTDFVGNSALHGGGMFCAYSAETTIVGCTIRQNRAGPVFDPNDPDDPNASVDGKGGGIFCFAAPALFRDCIISYNIANTSGGAIYMAGSSDSPQISNCLITNNLAGRDGGGISINWYAEPLISNCTCINNAAAGTFGEVGNTGFGGGLYCSYGSDSEVNDSIFWNNYAIEGSEIAVATGFELDPRPSTLTISYSDIKAGALAIRIENGCTLVGWNKTSNSWYPYTHNINANPLFITGLLGDYYLSQTAAGQSQNSPCVNSGSDLASNLGMVISPFDMVRYTTRTDGELDRGIVDMGYHYNLTIEACSFCDLYREAGSKGFINFFDFAMFALQWLNEGCSDDNDWCHGADLTIDTYVDTNDLTSFIKCWLVKDMTAPVPNPSKWQIEPYLISATSIGMSAETSFDTWGWGIEYFFKCAYGNCHDSSWQSSPTYTDSGLASGAIYGYMVKARDELSNETEWSVISYAGQEDTTPPAPAPYINTIQAPGPYSITMTSTVAYDESGAEYYFDCDTAGGHDSSWQSSPTYTDTSLSPNTTYYYRVKARDNSPAQNETAWSGWVSATTPPPVDNLPPQPNPMAWDPTVDANGFSGNPRLINIGGGTFDWYATMMAIQATDVAPPGVTPSAVVEYKFVCVTSGLGALSSPWQLDLTYTVQVGGKHVVTDWYVKARDEWGNETAASPVVRAQPPP